MKSKRRVKERHVSQLRKLIGAVAEQNGEEGTLPMSFLPVRAIITILSVAAVVYGVVVFGSAAVVEAGLFQALQSMFSTRDSEIAAQVGKVLFGLAIHFGLMFAFVTIVLYCCYKSVYWEWNKLVVRGNEEVATWKAAPKESSRRAVEVLEAYLCEHTTITEESPSKVEEKAHQDD